MDDIVYGITKSQTQLSDFHRELHCYIKDFQIYQDLYVAENMDDVKQLWDFYAGGWALGIKWYAGEDPGFISII